MYLLSCSIGHFDDFEFWCLLTDLTVPRHPSASGANFLHMWPLVTNRHGWYWFCGPDGCWQSWFQVSTVYQILTCSCSCSPAKQRSKNMCLHTTVRYCFAHFRTLMNDANACFFGQAWRIVIKIYWNDMFAKSKSCYFYRIQGQLSLGFSSLWG